MDFGFYCNDYKDLPNNLYPAVDICDNGFIMPFSDGPKPLYKREVGKSVIKSLVACSNKYFYITTPYLIIDNDLSSDIENAALRGVDVRIIVPKIPDKKLIYLMTKTSFKRLIGAGVKVYEYTPGFIHAKTYLVDDNYAMIGTINLDYRSLVHHYENGVLMYKASAVEKMKSDVEEVIKNSRLIEKEELKSGIFERIFTSLVKLFAPLM
jgi:cardiolipin synthase